MSDTFTHISGTNNSIPSSSIDNETVYISLYRLKELEYIEQNISTIVQTRAMEQIRRDINEKSEQKIRALRKQVEAKNILQKYLNV